jgi:Zn-finger nucleic acid-binding protein
VSSGDLSGDRSAYRDGTIRCPGCAEIMRQEPVPSAEVDVCDACGGLWIDWFDGDIPTLAAEAEAARVDRESALLTPIPRGPAIHGGGTCPRCMRALAADTFRFPDADPNELIDHVELLRCAECAGSFVPRASAHLLLDRAKEPSRSVSIWAALVELLKRLVAR